MDDSHATGFVGPTVRGTWEHCDVPGRVDIITTTFGKALGGASGGAVASRAEIVEYFRQKSRPYHFSNALAPGIVGGTLEALAILKRNTDLRGRLESNTRRFRSSMTDAGFEIRAGTHPIVPAMLYEEAQAHRMADRLLAKGIYVIGFSLEAFVRVGRELGVIR